MEQMTFKTPQPPEAEAFYTFFQDTAESNHYRGPLATGRMFEFSVAVIANFPRLGDIKQYENNITYLEGIF